MDAATRLMKGPWSARILRNAGGPTFVACMMYLGNWYRGDGWGAMVLIVLPIAFWITCHKVAEDLTNPPDRSA